MTDYLAAHFKKEGDAEQSGVKGMRWGVRRDRSTLRAAAAKRKASTEKPAAASEAKKPAGNIQDNVESSSARYDRLAGQAKAGRASDMTEQDLKFFNARTEALSKVEKMNATDPSWIKTAATKVVQQTAQNQMQNLADGLANKYIGDPIKAALKAPEVTKSFNDRAKEGAANKIESEMLNKRVNELVEAYKERK